MSNITIKTKKEFFFGGAKKDKIKMCITKTVNIPAEEKYYLTIVDSCVSDYKEEFPEVDADNNVIGVKTINRERVLGFIEREISLTYGELNELAQNLKLDRSKIANETEFINETIRQGLYAITVNECKAGLLGEKGKGRYQTTATDWEIVR